MGRVYVAHKKEETHEIQTVKQHSENTAKLCREFAIPAFGDVLYTIGLLHDIGKYQDSFQLRISGRNIRVEHSGCGAAAVEALYGECPPLARLMEYCIAGHHAGIPDGGSLTDTADMATLWGRLRRNFEDYSAYGKELELPNVDGSSFVSFLMQDCDGKADKLIDKFAFLTRYSFSCLVDADSIDTAEFCGTDVNQILQTDFKKCLIRIDEKLSSFVCRTTLQKSRACLQKQVFEKVNKEADIYLMNMPTGSGKTLCSMKFALERVQRGGKKRIIYIIPYNGIIDQTMEVFEELFGEDAQILRHQSTFSYEDSDYDEDYRLAAGHAAENWNAQIILTTAVQFFESVYANKRGKLRKLHNMADSVLVFDEAHLMPETYLQPCLEAVSYITRYLNSEAVFLTATMPDFSSLIHSYAMPESRIVDLIDDTSLFSGFQKCSYQHLGEVSCEELLEQAEEMPSCLIVVNKKETARRLYALCRGQRYHLSTYMTAVDRKRVIGEIREALRCLERDYPDWKDVPEERRIIVFSTSLIEAGVDLDFYGVYRELTGLDSILQAGGRCNREGKRPDAAVSIFELSDEKLPPSLNERGNITRGLLREFEDISCAESIQAYYNRLFFHKSDEITENAMYRWCQHIESIPFQEYAKKFEVVDSDTVPIVVIRDGNSRELVESMRFSGIGNARKLQKYACSVYPEELNDLQRQHVIDDFGTGIYCLTNQDYYDPELGILFEAKDYIL